MQCTPLSSQRGSDVTGNSMCAGLMIRAWFNRCLMISLTLSLFLSKDIIIVVITDALNPQSAKFEPAVRRCFI